MIPVHRVVAAVAALAALAGTRALAQENAGVLGGAVVWSAQQVGESDSAPNHRRPGIGGSTAGVVASGGIRPALAGLARSA